VASLVIVVSAVLVLSCGQTDKTHTDMDERLTPATIIDMSNNRNTGNGMLHAVSQC